jgi:hypothetical protein
MERFVASHHQWSRFFACFAVVFGWLCFASLIIDRTRRGIWFAWLTKCGVMCRPGCECARAKRSHCPPSRVTCVTAAIDTDSQRRSHPRYDETNGGPFRRQPTQPAVRPSAAGAVGATLQMHNSTSPDRRRQFRRCRRHYCVFHSVLEETPGIFVSS